MTDERRARRARASERALTPSPTSTVPQTVEALRRGARWMWGNPHADGRSWATGLDYSGLPPDVCRAVGDLADNASRTAVVAAAEACERAAAEAGLTHAVRERCAELGERARLLAAFLGDYVSTCIAMHQADLALGASTDDAERRMLLVTRAELSYVAHLSLTGVYDASRDAARTKTRNSVWEDIRAESELVQFWVGLDAKAAGPVRDDTGMDPRDEDHPLADDWFDEPLPDAAPAPPGIVVLRSVGHLPGHARDGTRPSGGSTPRAEFAALAGVALGCAPPPDLSAVRARLVSRYPHAAAVIDRILALAVGQPYARLRPALLVGPPGCGKTRLAREICEAMGLPVTVYSCAGVADSSLIGTSRQWGTGRASVPLQAIKRAMLASVALVIDEIEKVADSRHNGNAQDGLLSLLDHAGRYHDPYLECDTDLGAVTFLATANGLGGITAPLRDRFLVLEMPVPTRESLPAIVDGIMQDLRAELGQDEAWLPPLDGEELAAVVANWRPGGSIRALRRLVEAALAARTALAPRH
ncbi:Lon protease [Methylorubrum aminovorans]